MTSKLKCPFCQQELHKDPDGYYSCYTDNCSVMSAGGNGASGTESLWTALIQAKQDLEIARKALESISGIRGNIEDYYGGVYIHYQQMVLHMDEIATNALEQIDHKD